MAYDEYLQERIERVLNEKSVRFESKKMMGGLCFMVNDKMCCGIVRNDFMARVGENVYLSLLEKSGARPMDFTKRPMKGYIFVSPDGVDKEEDLEFWIQACLDFNPQAKSSKKKS